VHIGEVQAEKAQISVLDYDESNVREKVVDTIEECLPFKDAPTVTWINITGLHEIALIEAVGKSFNLHPLILEDIAHTGQRPKMEEYENLLFIVIKMLRYKEDVGQIDEEQVSLILGPNWVLSFQEREGDVFDPLRERIRNGKGRIRKMGADYLAYSLLDAVVDHYFLILERLGDRIEVLGEALLIQPVPQTLAEIHDLKRELLFLRKSVWPLRGVINGLQRGESPLFHPHTLIYLRDLYDHTIQVMDAVETFRDMTAGMLDIYLSSASNRMNEIMKVLTIIATIFIPLTFIAGIYGMNFQFMPELKWPFGYFCALGFMSAVAIGLLIYFRRRKWL
jgi:magnesium transporter